MLIYHDPDEYKSVFEHITCAFHMLHPGESFAGCTCSSSLSTVRREPEEIAVIKADRRRMEEDRIIAEAEIIKARRATARKAETPKGENDDA